MTCLIDTGAFYAPAARAFFRRHLETGRFATTDSILFESWTLIGNKLRWEAAHRFMEGFRKSGISLLYVEPVDMEVAWRVLNDCPDQRLSLADAASFALMERHGISHAFTFDKDFLLYRYGPKKQRSFTCCP